MKVIEVDSISKKYRLGNYGSGTFTSDIRSFFVRKKKEEQVAPGSRVDAEGNFWALQDISFGVSEGEVLGIIGHNGAGKSTLLKILSQITAPSTGEIRIKGRVASLLEVGTGFHPELSGRENIFLNGAILGMTKREIKASFDEIVAFSGIEHHIDTPVKRYSSGMKVRLGFAVAAHLQPEILVIDEVLAVGDAEFQKKCLGKMKDVASKGRTVLFVSHNMTAVRSLCPRSVLLRDGRVVFDGDSAVAIGQYLGQGENRNIIDVPADVQMGSEDFRIRKIQVLSGKTQLPEPVSMTDGFMVDIDVEQTSSQHQYDITLQVKGAEGNILFVSGTGDFDLQANGNGSSQMLTYRVRFPSNFFNSGTFDVNLMVVKNRREAVYYGESLFGFTVVDAEKDSTRWMGRAKGDLRPMLQWEIKK